MAGISNLTIINCVFSLKGFYKWSLLVYNNTLINVVTWPATIFQIRELTLLRLVGSNSYLSNLKQFFEGIIGNIFKCPKNFCSETRLMYIQYLNQNVTTNIPFSKRIIPSMRNLTSLVNELPVLKYDVELNFYNNHFKNKTDKDKYKLDLSLSQVEFLFPDQDFTPGSLLKVKNNLFLSSNMMDLFYYNITKNNFIAYRQFRIDSIQKLGAMSYYLFNFAIQYYSYLALDINGTLYNGIQEDKAFITFVPYAIQKSIEILKNKIRLVVIARLTFIYIFQKSKRSCDYYISKVVLSGKIKGNK